MNNSESKTTVPRACPAVTGSLPSDDGVKMPDAVTKKLQKFIDDQEPMPADMAEIINEDLFDLT